MDRGTTRLIYLLVDHFVTLLSVLREPAGTFLPTRSWVIAQSLRIFTRRLATGEF